MRKLILSTLLFAWSMTVYAAQSDNIHKESTDIVGTNIAPPVSKTSNNNLSLANTSQALVSKTTNNIPLADFKNSMVYVRCIFYIDNKVQLMWGKIDKSQNSLAQEAVYPYAVIKGTWYNSSSTRESTLNNVFYTKASVDDVLNTCKFAFKEKKYAIEKFNTQFINYFAALSQYSFDYDFWFNDGLKGVENRPSKTALINQLVVFGDSLSDTHHMFNKSLWVIPDPKRYLYGRFTNGLVWSEYVAQYLGVNLLTLAEGGSEVVPEGSQGFATKSLKEQYDNYVNFYKNIPQGYDKAIEKSLFVVFTGGNDFLALLI